MTYQMIEYWVKRITRVEVGFGIWVVRRRWFNISNSGSVGHHAGAGRSPRTARLQLNLLFIRKHFETLTHSPHAESALLIQGKLEEMQEFKGS